MCYAPSFYERIGEEMINNQGEHMKIIEYTTCNDLLVMFKDTGNVVKSTYGHFKDGSIKDNLFKNVKKGERRYTGNTKTKDENGKCKKSYSVWSGIVGRCTGEKFQDENLSYNGCRVCNEWLCYANFEKWYDENYYDVDDEVMCVDKDILVKGNKVYSPETCMIVPMRINSLFKHRRTNKPDYPIGVTKIATRNLFTAVVRTKGGKRKTTYHKTPEEAFYSYKKMKEAVIKEVADEYKDKIPRKLYDAMYAYKIEITD